MELLLTALAPFVVTAITQGFKKLKSVRLSEYRKTLLRFVAVLLSFASSVVVAVVSGGDLDVADVETFAHALLTFLGSTGVYLLSKKSTA